MQKMTKQPPLFALVPVPYEALIDAGIDICEPLQFAVEDGRITMEPISPQEEIDYFCENARRDCPRICCDRLSSHGTCPIHNNNDENEVY